MLHGPYLIKELISTQGLSGLDAARAQMALDRWQSAIDAAKNAHRSIPIIKTIEGRKTALVVVDMQRAFLERGAAVEVVEGRAIVPNINKAAGVLRARGGLVIFLRYLVDERVGLLKHFESKSYLGQDRESPMIALRSGHPQFELYPELDVQADDLVLNKIRYSAVLGSDITRILRKRDIENTIITGVTTDVCAGNTAEDLMQVDFHVVMVWDATAAMDRLEHEFYLARIFGLYGDVMPTEEVIQRMT